MSEELKPGQEICPFCGLHDAIIQYYDIRSPDNYEIIAWFECQSCGARGPAVRVVPSTYDIDISELKENAGSAWNRRYKSLEIPGWLKDKIKAEIEIQQNDCGLKAEALYWVLSLRRGQP